MEVGGVVDLVARVLTGTAAIFGAEFLSFWRWTADATATRGILVGSIPLVLGIVVPLIWGNHDDSGLLEEWAGKQKEAGGSKVSCRAREGRSEKTAKERSQSLE